MDANETAARLRVYAEISAERSRQDLEHGGPEHDDGHTQDEWAWMIGDHTQRSLHNHGRNFRQQMVRVAALALAAVESQDRDAARLEDLRRRSVPDATGDDTPAVGGEA